MGRNKRGTTAKLKDEGCGCYEKTINKASTNERLEQVRKVAKQMAIDEKMPYVVVKKDNGSFTFMPEKFHAGSNSGEVVDCFSPL
jgi:hypothetical protein